MNEERIKQLSTQLQTFFDAETMAEKKAYLQQHPDILTNEAMQLLYWNIEKAKAQKNEQAYRRLAIHFNLLIDCHQVGLDHAFGEQIFSESKAQLNFLHQAIQLIYKNDDPKIIYPFFEANLPHINLSLTQILLQLATNILNDPNPSPNQAIFIGTIAIFSNLIQQFPLGSRANNLEIAIVGYQVALQVFTRETLSQEWADTQNNLATIYCNRILGERANNLEQAIAHYKQALQVQTHETFPKEWAETQNNLANAYCYRIQGGRADNLKQAIAHCEQALQVLTREAFPEDWAITQHNLANAYNQRVDNLEQAIAHYEQALQVFTREAFPQEWARTLNNLAVAYCDRIRGEQEDNLEQAIVYYEQVLQVRTRETLPEEWAATQNSLANTYRDRIRGEQATNLEQAIHHYKQSLQVYTRKAFPTNHRRTVSLLGDIHFAQQQWQPALDAYQQAIQVNQLLLETAYTDVGRQHEVEQYNDMYVHAAYCQLKLGHFNPALATLEQGKARLLNEALALNNADLAALPPTQQQAMHAARQRLQELDTTLRFMGQANRVETTSPDYEARRQVVTQQLQTARAELRQLVETIRQTQPDFMPSGLGGAELLQLIPPQTVLVAPLITTQGSAVLLLPSGLTDITSEQVLWLDDFTQTELQAMLVGTKSEPGWLRVYLDHQTRPSAWQQAIQHMGAQLWEKLFNPIVAKIGTTATSLVIMPQGGLGLLPLHAAWDKATGQYLLDLYEMTTVSSGYAWHVSQARAHESTRQAANLLAVINPTGDLRYAYLEGLAVAELATHTKLIETQATKAAVLGAAKADPFTYLHLSCHGYYNWQNALQSGLHLASDTATAKSDPLTLLEIITQLDLRHNRLVTLSACETGMTEFQKSPDEFIGLPAGFLQAGATGVVSTLWAVDDRASGLLMEEFYRHHLKEGQSPAIALRGAQQWLRGAPRNELITRLKRYLTLLQPTEAEYTILNKQITSFLSQYEPTDHPYQAPYFWAAFMMSGV